jgi:hypothetical protein
MADFGGRPRTGSPGSQSRVPGLALRPGRRPARRRARASGLRRLGRSPGVADRPGRQGSSRRAVDERRPCAISPPARPASVAQATGAASGAASGRAELGVAWASRSVTARKTSGARGPGPGRRPRPSRGRRPGRSAGWPSACRTSGSRRRRVDGGRHAGADQHRVDRRSRIRPSRISSSRAFSEPGIQRPSGGGRPLLGPGDLVVGGLGAALAALRVLGLQDVDPEGRRAPPRSGGRRSGRRPATRTSFSALKPAT